MYICQVTGKMSEPGEKLNRIVVEKRDRTYTERVFNEESRKMEEIEVGHGWEIVREISASDEGARMWETMNEDERSHFVSLL